MEGRKQDLPRSLMFLTEKPKSLLSALGLAKIPNEGRTPILSQGSQPKVTKRYLKKLYFSTGHSICHNAAYKQESHHF